MNKFESKKHNKKIVCIILSAISQHFFQGCQNIQKAIKSFAKFCD